MSKLVIMQGLPGSGKSTKAAELVRESGNAIRVNRDLLREMLHFGKFSGDNEQLTTDAELALIKLFLDSGKKVVVDDTNLSAKTVNKLVALTKDEPFHKVEFCKMATSIEECIIRDQVRGQKGERSVGPYVIMNMARRYGLFDNGKKDVLVDMDGTLADVEHRRHFVNGEGKKDWNGFFEAMDSDPVRKDVAEMVDHYAAQGCNIVIVSARPEKYRDRTVAWLHKNIIPFQTIIMRANGDSRDDVIVKQGILDSHFKKDNIEAVIDDRPRVIRMWESNGLKVHDVGKGIEF